MAQAALDAFVAITSKKERSFHLFQVATVTVGGTFLGGFTYDLDVAGQDISADLTYPGRHVQVVVKGDRMWAKEDVGDWVEGARDDATLTEILDVFRYLGDPRDLVYIGGRSAGGQPAEAFRNDRPIPYQSATMKDQGITGMSTAIQLWLLPDGTPRMIRVRTEADAPNANGMVQRISTNSVIELTHWGEAIEIEQPV